MSVELNSSTEAGDIDDAVSTLRILHSTPIRGKPPPLPLLPQSPHPLWNRIHELENSSAIVFNDVFSLSTNSISSIASTLVMREKSGLAFRDSSAEFFAEFTLSPAPSPYPRSVCCFQQCIESINMSERGQICNSFMSRSRCDQRQFLFDIVITSAKRNESNSLIVDGYMLCGKKVCRKAFLSILSISQKRLRTVERLVESRAISAKPTLLSSRSRTQKVEITSVWMESYFKRIGDRMPHTEQVHLPSFLTKTSIYHQMMAELFQQGHTENDIISLSHFYALWNERFSYCIIPKVFNMYYARK